MGVLDSIPFVFGLTCSRAEKEPDWVELPVVEPFIDDAGDDRRSLS
jgi:hypothetical protein